MNFTKLSLVVSLVAILFALADAECYAKCKKSVDCPPGYCCRANTDNSVLISNTQGGMWPPPFPENDPREGYCKPIVAQLDELCDESCPCDDGLFCQRPLTGVCCAPFRCFNQTQSCIPPDCIPPE